MREVDPVVVYRAVMRVLADGYVCDVEADFEHQTSTIPCYLQHPWTFVFTIGDAAEKDMKRRTAFAQRVVLEALKLAEGETNAK